MKHLKNELIEELQRLMAEELEAFLRYFQLRHRLDGPPTPAAKFFATGMRETLEHAEEIASHIARLEVTPKLNIKLNVKGTPVSIQEGLAEALIFEQQALEAYQDMLPRTIDYPDLQDFIRRQVAIENTHVQEIRMMLE